MKHFSFTLKQLKILQEIKIKNEINITIAAENLYLSQPALSSQIRKLEHNLSSKILLRKKKQISFTSEGELILDYANKILRLCEEADRALLYFKKFKISRLNIGSNKLIGKYISTKIIDLFCKRYSYANVQLKFGSTKSISWDLINGKIDIGIVQEDELPKNLSNSLYTKRYFEEKICLIVTKATKEKFLTRISKETLYSLNFINIKSCFEERQIMDNNLKKFNINMKKLKIKFEVNSVETLKYAIQAGLGVSFLSTIYVKRELESKRLHSIILKNNNKKNFMVVINLKNNDSYLCEQFYNHCFAMLQ
ncbi:unnamed protein product, partial [Ectocarpus sp. 4 AP-2014]